MDCLILGGGITGAGIARDAAMRGLRTLLVDSHDFASGTSHLTSKLIHGGLRYLDQGKFRLVAEGIMERDRLLNRMAPNLVHPLKFVIPYEGRRFPKWLLTVVGIQSYGFIELARNGRACLPLFAGQLRRAYPTLLEHPFGVSYWDAQTNDARLVLATLRTAHAHGAQLLNYTTLEKAEFDGDGWRVELVSDDMRVSVRARTVVNATGPWSPRTAESLGLEPPPLVWLKGSHLLVTRKPSFGNDAIIIQSVRDKRPLWVIPWHTRLIVGSTERRYHGDLRDVHPDADEVDDLWDSLVHFFPRYGLSRSDIRGAYAGVRPIVPQDEGDENRLSRRHQIDVDRRRALITVNGGKLTTFRKMAEETMDAVAELLHRPPTSSELRVRLRNEMLWPQLDTHRAAALCDDLTAQWNGTPHAIQSLRHWVRLYGTQAADILAEAATEPGWSEPLFDGLPYGLAELTYLCRHEFVRHLADLVKRRTSIYFLADRAGIDMLPRVAETIAPILHWNSRRCDEEIRSIEREFQADTRALTVTGNSASSVAPMSLATSSSPR